MSDFKFIDSIAPSDAAFKATGKTLEDLFGNCALAVTSCMVDIETVSLVVDYEVRLEAKTEEELLYDWLSELVFIKDSERLFTVKFDIEINKADVFQLSAKIWGDKIDYNKQNIHVDVKAVTMHMFKLVRKTQGWEAFVVLDL